ASQTNNRIATAAVVILLMALAASAYFVFKGRNPSQPITPVTTQASPNVVSPTGQNETEKATAEQTAAANEDKAKIESLQAEIEELRRSQDKAQDKSKTKPE